MKRKLNIGLIATTALTLSGCNGSLDKLTNEQKDQMKNFSRSAAQVQGIRKALQAQGGVGQPQVHSWSPFGSDKTEPATAAPAAAASTGTGTGVAGATGTASATASVTASVTSTGAASTGIDKGAATTASSTGVAAATTTVVTPEKQTTPEAQTPTAAVMNDELTALGLSSFENFNSNTAYQTAFATMKSALKDKCGKLEVAFTFGGNECPFTSSLKVEENKSTFRMDFKDDLTQKLGYKTYVYTLDNGTKRLEMTDSTGGPNTAEWTRTGNEKEFQEKTVFTFDKFNAELDLRQKADGTKTFKLNDEDVSEADYLVYVAPFAGDEKPLAPAAVK